MAARGGHGTTALIALFVLLALGGVPGTAGAQEGEFVVPIDVTVTDGGTPRSDLVDARLGSDGSLIALGGNALLLPLRLMAVPEALSGLEDQEWLEPADLDEAGFRVTTMRRFSPSRSPFRRRSSRCGRSAGAGAAQFCPVRSSDHPG
jgi:hypothetical protein